jgi:hypothetical protein
MKLKFAILAQPLQKRGGRRGQGGQSTDARVPASPKLSHAIPNEGNPLRHLDLRVGGCPLPSPICSPAPIQLRPAISAVVPRVPCRPPDNGQNLKSEELPPCYIHRANRAKWWTRADGSMVCGLCHPDPYTVALEGTAQIEPQPMPKGVTLLRWAPERPPVAIERWAVVNDVPQFIQTTLRQLQAAMAGENWLAGNCSVRELVDRLEQVGVNVTAVVEAEEGTPTVER